MYLISVIIVNWNGEKFIEECLDGLKKQSFKNFSIIIADNGSDDGSLELIQNNYSEVKTIALHENLGFAAANNIALKTIHTEYVALLNNDAVPHRLWLKSLVEGLDAHPEAGFAGSKMLYYDNPGIIDRAGDVFTTSGTALLRGRGKPSDTYNEKEYVFGACAGAALYRTEMLRNIGLFDEDFFLLYEDVDLSFRAQLQGYKCIYVPEAIVYHMSSQSIGYDSPISVYYSHRNLEWVYIQNMPGSLIIKTIFPHIIYNIASFIYFTAIGRGKEFIKAKWDALKGIKRSFQKRHLIQRNKKMNDKYIWSLFEKESFLSRLKRRLRKY